MIRFVGGALSVLAFVPATSHAATVTTRPDFVGRYQDPVLVVAFAAAAGERNDVVVESTPDGDVRITDRGAQLNATGQCESLSPHEALCRNQPDRVELDLGDGDDAYSSTWSNTTSVGGGEGDDVLAGGSADELLHGGAGADRVTGGAGDDSIAAPMPADTVHGGEGFDVAHYGAETTPLRIDVAGLPGFEHVVGGTAADEIVGTDGPETLEGREGDDVIAGRGGDDVVTGGAGRDRLDGGAGDDSIGTADEGPDAIACGTGSDVVREPDPLLAIFATDAWLGPDAGDLLPPDCERVSDPHGLEFDARVRTRGRYAVLTNPCLASQAEHCRGRLSVAAGGVRRSRRLTAAQLRLAFRLPRRGPVRVAVALRLDDGLPHRARWTAAR